MHGGWFTSKGLCGNAMSDFLVTAVAKNTMGPGWSPVANAGTSIGLTNLVQLPLHLYCLCGSLLILNLSTIKRWEHVEVIVVPGKREGIDIASCCGIQDKYLCNCLLILVAKRSMTGFSNFSTILWKRAGLSFPPSSILPFLDCLSTLILIVPGICAAGTHNWFLAHCKFEISCLLYC